MKNFFLILFLAILLGPTTLYAFSIDLTTSKDIGFPVITYGTVNGFVDDSDNSIFHFEISLSSNLKTILNGGDNFRFDKFYFNSDLNLTNDMFKNILPDDWSLTDLSKSTFNVNEFGNFVVEMMSTGSATTTLKFDIDYTSTVTEGNFLVLSTSKNQNKDLSNFAAHIGGFSYNGYESTYVRDGEIPTVPEPSTLILLGGGLIGLAFLRRRLH